MSAFSSLLRRALYELMYWRGKPRWDTGITPPELQQLVEAEHFPRGRALDIGCGTGTNVIYLALHGFATTGIDFVPRAIDKARAKARAAGVKADLRVVNVLQRTDLGAPFDLALDIGCFHNFDDKGRESYAQNLGRWTHGGSTFLLYAFFPGVAGLRRFGVTPEQVQAVLAPEWKVVWSNVGQDGASNSAWYRLERVPVGSKP